MVEHWISSRLTEYKGYEGKNGGCYTRAQFCEKRLEESIFYSAKSGIKGAERDLDSLDTQDARR